MALIHWWPLNGNLNDYGEKPVNVVNNGATVNTAGKIGNCYSFDGSDDCISISSQSLFDCFKGGSTPFSITMWIYNNESSGARGVLFGDCGTEGTIINFNIEINTGSISNNSIRFYWGNSPDWNANSSIISPNKWTHLSVIYDGTSVRIYTNGNLTNTRDGTLVSRSKTSGYFLLGRDGRTGATAFKGRLNDVRIYDHALSAKEVKEISKGLVLHYTFEDPWIEPTTNIKPWSSTINSSTVAWDVSLNDGSIAYSRQGWSNGYNAVVSAPTTGYHAHWVWENNDLIMKFPNLNSVIGKKGRWLGIRGSMTIPWSANDKYTISWEQKTDNLSLAPFGGVYYKLTSSGSSSFHDGDPVFAYNTKLNTWQKVSHTFTAKSTFDGTSTTAALYVYGYNTTHEGTIYVRNVQIEYKDHVTPFVAETRPVGKVYDSSGYGYNGTLSNSNAQIIENAPYGKYSMYLNGGTYISHSRPVEGGTNQEWTVSAWLYPMATTANTKLNSFNLGNRLYHASGGNGLMYINYGTNDYYRYSSEVLSTNQWTMVTFVFRNSDGRRSIYYNAVQKDGSGSNYTSTPAGISDTVTALSTFSGYVADYKIYATALSADDILAEYQRKAAIDKSGNLYTGEFIEDNSNAKLPTKKDQIITTDFVEGSNTVRIFGNYTQLEYTQNTDKTTIDTGYYLDMDNDSVEVTFQATQVAQNGMILATTSSSSKYFWIYHYNQLINCYIDNGSGQNNLGGPTRDTNKHTAQWINKQYIVDDVVYGNQTRTLGITPRKVTLFSYDTGGSYPYQGKIFDCKIWNANGLVRHFIPAKRNRDNVIGMFDLAEGKFYGPSGTGTFTAGQEIGSMSVISANEIKEN